MSNNELRKTRIPIFVINLDRSTDRWVQFRDQASAHGIAYERVRGCDGHKEIPSWLSGQLSLDGSLRSGEIGCYASHLSVCKLVVDRQLDAAIILEDDIALRLNFEAVARAAAENAPAGWDVIHLSTNFKRPAYPLALIDREHSIVRYARMPANSAAYIISKQGAEKLMIPGARTTAYDMEFRYAWKRNLEIYGVYPPPSSQRTDLPSTIYVPRDPAVAVKGFFRKRHRRPSLSSQLIGRLFVLGRLGIKGQLYVLGRSFASL